MKIYLPLVTMFLSTGVAADEDWFQLIIPTGEIAKHAKVAIPDSNSGTQYYMTDSDGRVSLPAESEALRSATLEFAGKRYTIDVQDFNFTDHSGSVKRIIVNEQ